MFVAGFVFLRCTLRFRGNVLFGSHPDAQGFMTGWLVLFGSHPGAQGVMSAGLVVSILTDFYYHNR